MTIVDVPDGVSDLQQADRLATEGMAHEEALAFELDAAVVLHAPYLEVHLVLDRRQDARVRPWAGSIARSWDLEAQGFVRPLQVVTRAPAVEGCLRLELVVPDRPLAQHLQLERAVKALLLALGLEMVRATVQDRDTQADQRGREGSVQALATGAEGAAVVHEHA